MINVLIFLALCVVFACGWWVGKRYITVNALLAGIKASMRTRLDDKPAPCEICKGARGGVPGNENFVQGVRLCDYCHADRMQFDRLASKE